MKRCGYATDKSYANKLIQTIELYELYKYDRRSFKPIRAKDLLPVIVANPHPVYRSWGLLYVEARDGDSLESIAKEFGFSVKKLAKYNEVPKDYPLEAGDLNVAHQEIDLKNPKTNRKNAGFTDEERYKFTQLLSAGFTDTFRYFYPDQKDIYSWWSYRFKAREKNAGWRIDYFRAAQFLVERCRGKKKSIRQPAFFSLALKR